MVLSYILRKTGEQLHSLGVMDEEVESLLFIFKCDWFGWGEVTSHGEDFFGYGISFLFLATSWRVELVGDTDRLMVELLHFIVTHLE